MKLALTHYGRLDIVVNNVGYWDEKDYQKVMDINLGTTVRVTNAALSLLGKDKGGPGGILVHTASNGGLDVNFVAPIYCATKAAVIHYTRCWSHEVNYQSHGVRMFTICPTVTDTVFAKDSNDPKKCVHQEIFNKVLENTEWLKASDVGEALIEGLLDDTANGVALKLITPKPDFLFRNVV